MSNKVEVTAVPPDQEPARQCVPTLKGAETAVPGAVSAPFSASDCKQTLKPCFKTHFSAKTFGRFGKRPYLCTRFREATPDRQPGGAGETIKNVKIAKQFWQFGISP